VPVDGFTDLVVELRFGFFGGHIIGVIYEDLRKQCDR
jgi:hypothetical protein